MLKLNKARISRKHMRHSVRVTNGWLWRTCNCILFWLLVGIPAFYIIMDVRVE